MAMASRDERLISERNLWLATTRPTGKPHLAPIWFVAADDSIWVCTGLSSVKAKNMMANQLVSFALQDGDDPMVGEGRAELIKVPPTNVVNEFGRKFEWDITTDADYGALFRITVTKWLHATTLTGD